MLDDLAPDALVTLTSTGWQIPLQAGDLTLLPGVPTRVPVRVAKRFASMQGVKVDWSEMAEHFRSYSKDGRPSIDFWAPLSTVDGYGRHAYNIYQGLAQIGVDVTLKPSELHDISATLNGSLETARQNLSVPPSKVAVTMSVPRDEILTDNPSLVRIAITQFETDTVPKKHVERVSRCDHLITTSGFQPAIWKKSGLKIPISVLTPGINTDYFAYKPRRPGPLFRCLILGALSPRKNTEEAVRIFWEASAQDPNWRLTIKTRGYNSDYVKAMAARDTRITYLVGDASDDYIRQLYYDHDCFLWPSKGEGVGLPPLEAMATGMELVCSDNSGMMDYVADERCYPIKTQQMIPGLETWGEDYVEKWGDVGNYWLPDRGHAIKQLEKCQRAWSQGKGKGEKAAQYVRGHHTLEHQARSVMSVVEKYL